MHAARAVRVETEWTVKKRILISLLMLLMGMSAVPLTPTLASAEIAPYAQDTWGVYNYVQTGTLTQRIRNEVFAIEQIGNRIYIGGKFTEVRQNANSAPISQAYLAAFDAGTGAYISSFTPTFDRPVYSLQASPDGSRLFVGGEFGDVEGVSNTRALVALNPTTGAVDTTWKAQLKLNGRAVVYTMDMDQNWLYVGGTFSAVGGAGGVPQISVSRAVKLDLDDAHPDTSWHPTVSGGGVWGIAVSPDRNSVYLAGYFSSVNAVGGTQGFVGVDNVTGSNIRPGRIDHNNPGRTNYQDVVAVNGLVFVAGMEHITYALNASDLSVRTLHTTGGTNQDFGLGGDYQDLEVVGNRVYASCHCRGEHFADGDVYRFLIGQGGQDWSRRDPIKFVAAYSATNGSYIPSFQLDISASSGVWAIHGSPDGCLWLGGDITRATRANGANQARGAFTKHCDTNMVDDNQRPSVPRNLAVSSAGSTANLAWTASTDNVGVVGYDIYRSTQNGNLGSLAGTSTNTGFSDNGLGDGTYWYYLKARDAAGNTSWRTGMRSVTIGAAADSERPGVASGFNATAAGNSVSLAWNAATDNVAVSGYRIYRAPTANGAASLVATAPSTSYVDQGVADGDYWYYIRAIDAAGNEGWRTGKRAVTVGGAAVDTERPSTPGGLVTTNVAATQVSLSWNASTDNVGVTQYVVINNANGSVVGTSTGTTITIAGLTGGTNYSFFVKAQDAAGNRSWRSNIKSFTTL